VLISTSSLASSAIRFTAIYVAASHRYDIMHHAHTGERAHSGMRSIELECRPPLLDLNSRNRAPYFYNAGITPLPAFCCTSLVLDSMLGRLIKQTGKPPHASLRSLHLRCSRLSTVQALCSQLLSCCSL
jgi:hypothetical protein